MTLTFIPGEPSPSRASLLQGLFKNHHVIVYASGNNVIIFTSTSSPQKTLSTHLQTVYLESDPLAVRLNSVLGLIAVAVKTTIIIYKPVNEYMSKPQWLEATRIEVEQTKSMRKDSKDSTISLTGFSNAVNCLAWAEQEDELVVGGNFLLVYHVRLQYGEVVVDRRSHRAQPAPVGWVEVSPDALSVATYSPQSFDRLVRVWSRITFDDDDGSLFELAYLLHPKGTFVKKLMLRTKNAGEAVAADISGMANIKNIRQYLPMGSSHDICYSVDSSSTLRVWSTYEAGGHRQIRCWKTVDLCQISGLDDIVDVVLVDTALIGGLNDTLMVVAKSGHYAALSVSNIVANPPIAIEVSLMFTKSFPTLCFPNIEVSAPKDFLSQQFSVFLQPLSFSISKLHDNKLCLLLHDRQKHTIRAMCTDSLLGTILLNKFQGLSKSVRKLVSSSSQNVLLSISNFSKHNYIWEPLVVKGNHISLSKRFQIDLGSEENAIWDAIIINDIRPSSKSHHLVITAEKTGILSVWDCNGLTGDDRPARLCAKVDISRKQPQALLLHQIEEDVYCVIGLFEGEIKAWKLEVENIEDSTDVSAILSSLASQNCPAEIYRVSTIDSFVSNNLLSVIDEKGLVQIFSACIDKKGLSWSEINRFHTNIPKASKIHGLSINRFAVCDESGYRLSVWDMKLGLLEYEEQFEPLDGPVRDLDWTSVELSAEGAPNAILSVGFARQVRMYSQLRYDYTHNTPAFTVVKVIDISDYTLHVIGDSIWVGNGNLIIGAGNQFFVDDKWVQIGSGKTSIDYTVRQLVGYDKNSQPNKEVRMSKLIKMLNGPLAFYHPQFLIQALFLNQNALCQDILVQLLQCLRKDEAITWNLNMNLQDKFFKCRKRKETDIFDQFNDVVLDLLVEKLTKVTLPLLTRHQQITLLLVISIVKQISSSTNISALDENGVRFMIGFKLFQTNLQQQRLTMRDVNWALHSDNGELLVSEVMSHFKNRVTWTALKQTGVSFWLNDTTRLTTLVEQCARNEFSDNRDPSGIISLFFLAIRKKQVLLGLWKTVSHQEKTKMVKFISNNFNEPRWRSAALKNAFVLLGKHRYMDAAYFFLLADLVKDCCVTVANKVNDVELAILIAKVYGSKETLNHLLENFMLPGAIMLGDRWTTLWIFWELGMKEISIQALIKSPYTVVQENLDAFSEDFKKNQFSTMTMTSASATFLEEDPVLAILFNNLRKRKISYLEGSKAVTPKEEVQFILKVALIYTRMGCDFLAVMVLKNWHFTHYDTKEQTPDLGDKDMFKEFKPPVSTQPTQFEEPDIMSSFDF